MARTIELSESALTDFDGIYDFIAQHNPRAAATVLRNLAAAIQRLANQPRLGRPYRRGRHRLRWLAHGDYLVFYRERPDVIDLVPVLHGKQNISDILDKMS